MVCRIAVIGDSSSSGIGLGKEVYPAKLYHLLKEKFAVEIINCATPGTTSADANRYYHEELVKQPIDFLIVYLGNNEGVGSAHKGYFSPFRNRLRRLFAREDGEAEIAPIILPPPPLEFSYQLPPTLLANTPQEFAKNLRAIFRTAKRKNTRLLILNPVANAHFPGGTGAVNSSYFCVLEPSGTTGRTPANSPVDGDSASLARGLIEFNTGRIEQARQYWRPLASIDNVAGFIARHNLACASKFENSTLAENQLRELLGEYDIYDSIIFQNLVSLKFQQGDNQGARDLQKFATDSDITSYRIRQPYRNAITSLEHQYDARYLDLELILDASDFIDYCHPTSEGHRKIAQTLAEIIAADTPSLTSGQQSTYCLKLPSPNYYFDPDQTLLDYYGIDGPIDQADIVKAIEAKQIEPTEQSGQESGLDKCVENFIQLNSKHPLFTDPRILKETWVPLSHEILTFPEYFLYRLLYNYSLRFEALRPLTSSTQIKFDRFSFTSKQYRSLILRVNDSDLSIELNLGSDYLSDIISRVFKQLKESRTIFDVVIDERIRTIKTWYTREAFRFGTHSRSSMLYARWDIDKLVEGLLVACVIAKQLNKNTVLAALDHALSLLLDLIALHEQHTCNYLESRRTFDFASYQADLSNLKNGMVSLFAETQSILQM